MTRFAVATISLTVLMVSFAVAQEIPSKVQVFAGYSLVHADYGNLNGTIVDQDLRQPGGTFGLTGNYSGWSGEGQYNATRWIGIAGDVGGRYGTPFTTPGDHSARGLPAFTAYSFLAGPVISYRTKSKITPYAHALFGVERASLAASTITGTSTAVNSSATSYDDFTMALGAGLDYKLNQRFSVRPAQLDWYHTSLDLNKFYGSAFNEIGTFKGLTNHENNLRFSAGVVARF
jgi:opacity protein-like surface antigen